jgi:hypothetical protein
LSGLTAAIVDAPETIRCIEIIYLLHENYLAIYATLCDKIAIKYH